jgi:hypothetical protein
LQKFGAYDNAEDEDAGLRDARDFKQKQVCTIPVAPTLF